MITLATLPQATEQEVFDHVVNHLLTQKKCSDNGKKSYMDQLCMYRGKHGLKCAAGCLIADEEYKEEFESIGTWEELVQREMVPDNHSYLIRQLQLIHDKREPHFWAECLEKLANKQGLKFNPPPTDPQENP